MKHMRMPIPVRLLSYARPYKARLALATGALLGLTTFQLLGPYLVRYAIDTGVNMHKVNGSLVAQGNVRTLLLAAVLITLAAAFRGLFQFWQTYTGEWVSQRV